MHQNMVTNDPHISLPVASTIIIFDAHVCVLTHEGEIITRPLGDRMALPPSLKTSTIMTCHTPWTATKIGLEVYPALDILELFAFCNPATFVTPTIKGLAKHYNLPMPQSCEDAPSLVFELCRYMLADLQSLSGIEKERCASIARSMGRQGAGWAWTPFILDTLGQPYDPQSPTNPKADMDIFKDIPEWAEEAPTPPNKFELVSGDETRAHLQTLLSRRETSGRGSESRPEQINYATRVTDHFVPKPEDDSPNLLIAQAGTGIGKTYGYLAPAQLWAQKNEGRVTVSTFTKNLQRQIEQDLDILYPDAEERSRKAVIQKGRENYLCLLNLEDMITASALAKNDRTIVAAGLMARWAMATPDGDLSGNSFPGWLATLLEPRNSMALADRRGECIYAACDHYHKCFIERMNRKAARAEIIINNHALTMIRAATEASNATTPFVIFDEAHHLFQAADSAYGANLSGVDTADLRRWLVGPEDEGKRSPRSSRSRGLRKRLEGLIDESTPASHDIAKILIAAKESLPAPGWRKRVFHHEPTGVTEKFLSALVGHVTQRAKDSSPHYSIECDIAPTTEGLIDAAKNYRTSLKKLQKPLADLVQNLRAIMEDKADDLDKDTMARLDALSASIERRSTLMVATWVKMLDSIIETTSNSDMIDWFEITRIEGRSYDVGMFRRYKNPMEPFGNSIRQAAHGVVMTSATLRTQKGEDENNWIEAEQQLGVPHLTDLGASKIDLPSPFDYKDQSKILIVTDIDKNNPMAVANAMKAIFEASSGGALGLFTSIQRLRQVYNSVGDALERQGIPLYAQHENSVDIGTLTDMFRDDERACLLGTDAMRDGIDVAGRSLRCMVFDRVPWPRPTILHRERRNIFGGRAYDENLTRLKLKQAYGRLIRSQSDKGVFVMLDGSTPTRLLDAFPDGVDIQRLKLPDALKDIKKFL